MEGIIVPAIVDRDGNPCVVIKGDDGRLIMVRIDAIEP